MVFSGGRGFDIYFFKFVCFSGFGGLFGRVFIFSFLMVFSLFGVNKMRSCRLDIEVARLDRVESEDEGFMFIRALVIVERLLGI